jgi:glutathione peroxidase
MVAILGRWWRVAGVAAVALAMAYIVGVATNLVPGDLLGQGSEAVARLTSADEGAGDAGASSADADFTLPIPTPFEDERVVAAFSPLLNLSCRKSDYGDDAEPSAAAFYVAAESDARARALAAPVAPQAEDVEALLNGHLYGAALSPVAVLSAPTPPVASAEAAGASADPASGSCPALLQHTFNRLQTGEPQSLCQFQGKVLLIVNTASYCGNTPQYEGLEAMYRKYRDRGLVVIGFPSNDFGGQEPGTNTQIAEFCRTTYGVQFPMFEKSTVAKSGANPLFVELIAKTGVAPRWNFHKYVVDRSGTRVVSFADSVKPESRDLVGLIEKLLADKAPSAKG